MNIGVVGYSSDQIDATAADTLLQTSFQQLIAQKMGNAPIRIISGLTNIGIPKLAYQIADQLGYQTVGISAQRALKVKCGIYAVDEQLIVGLEFGDESACFIDTIDYLVRVGGGQQSHREVELFKVKCRALGRELYTHLIEHELSLQA